MGKGHGGALLLKAGAEVVAMELMQMEMFVAVVEEGSVRAAAGRVFRTQPAVSIAIRKLEEEFEAPFLIGRGAVTTNGLTRPCVYQGSA